MPKLYHLHSNNREVTPISEFLNGNWFIGEVDSIESPNETWLGLFCKFCMYDVVIEYENEGPDHEPECEYFGVHPPESMLNKFKYLKEAGNYSDH